MLSGEDNLKTESPEAKVETEAERIIREAEEEKIRLFEEQQEKEN